MNEQTIRRLLKHTDLVAAVAVVVVVTMLIIPLPSMLLDLFITINISAALAVVIATMYLNKSLDFAAFPSLLLLTTMFRLAINVVGHAPDPDQGQTPAAWSTTSASSSSAATW